MINGPSPFSGALVYDFINALSHFLTNRQFGTLLYFVLSSFLKGTIILLLFSFNFTILSFFLFHCLHG